MKVLCDGSRECALMIAADNDLFGGAKTAKESARVALLPLRVEARAVDDEALSFDSLQHAVSFLQQMANDHSEQQALRELLSDVRSREDVFRFSHQELFEQIGQLLLGGVLRAVVL